MPRRLPAVVPLVVALLALLAVGPAAASAAPAKRTIKKAMWGPAQIDGKSQFPAYRDLGVGIYQYPLYWNTTAPTKPANPRDPADPAYRWPAELDYAVAQAKKYKIAPLIRISRTPGWANGGQLYRVLPTNQDDFADFLQAVATRYPTVHHWMIWEEPNQGQLDLQPSAKLVDGTEIPEDKPLNAVQRGQIGLYAQLIDRSYVRLKSLSRKNLVIGGNTTSCGAVSTHSIIRGLRLPDGKPPRMDMYGHNPYSPRAPDLKQGLYHPGCADYNDIDAMQRWLDRDLARGSRDRNMKIFVSEYSEPTSVPSFLFPWHVTPTTQARYITSALKIARQTKRIYSFGWYSFMDLPTNAEGVESRVGLVDIEGRKKKGYLAFKRG